MDAKAEAEKRYANVYADGQKAIAFKAGAVWALREFGDKLEESGANEPSIAAAIALVEFGWASEAHHIADGIEGR